MLIEQVSQFLRRYYDVERAESILARLHGAETDIQIDTQHSHGAVVHHGHLELCIEWPAGHVRSVPVTIGPHFIGRAPPVDIVIPSKQVSRIHCLLVVKEFGPNWLYDLYSFNGTYVNDERLRPSFGHAVHPNDQIRIADCVIALKWQRA